MIPKHLKKASDLQTNHNAICDGFLHQALKKTEIASSYIKDATTFYHALEKVGSLDELLTIPKLRDDLASACGFSDKAKSKLTNQELNSAIKRVLKKIYKENESDFNTNILYRYLLTKGDTLGGSMRNITGASAGIKFTELILNHLSSKMKKVELQKSKSEKIQRIIWDDKTMLFDVKPLLIGKNIDVILINRSDAKTTESELLSTKENYLACGELKGGIDPAGADEHWKTANSALGRIRKAFSKDAPNLFFIGAAIEASMAKEIFQQLQSGKLAHAANLNSNQQMNDLVDWLLSL